MKKKLLSLILVATMSFGITACGNSTDSKRVAELEEQTEELQQQLEEAKQGQTDSSTSTGNFDSETQSLIDSINADTAEYQGVCGADAKWYYKDNVLVIKGTGEISDNPWQSDEYKVSGTYSERIFKINWVIIDEGITTIYDYNNDDIFYHRAFGDIDELTKVVLPTSLEKIGASSFERCESLTSINIPDSVTTIGDSAFAYCSSLTSINLPDSLTTIGSESFKNCESLTSVNLSDGLATIGDGAFTYCSSLTSINLPDSLTTIGNYAFYECTSLEASTIEKIQSINAEGFGVFPPVYE